MTRRIPRLLARAPIPLYRHGFGWLFGRRIVMLEHRGRKTGMRRHVVLEALEHASGELILVSGYGRRAQWFRNVEADPGVRIWTGRRRGVVARAEILTGEECRDRLERYRRSHPRAAAALGKVLGIPDLAGRAPVDDDIGTRLPLIRVRYGTDTTADAPGADG